jgi:hypothetical protein
MATDYPKILHDNRLDDGTPAASSTASGNFDVLNLRDFRPYTKFKPASLPATITVDCGSAKAVDYWAVYGHDLYTGGCTIELRGSTDNFSASDVLVDTLTPASNDPFVRLIASVSYRYWRLRITGTTAPTLALAALGVAFDIPAYLASGFDPIGRTIKGQANRSEMGHPLGRTVKYEEWSETLKFELVTWAWVRSSWLAAWRAHVRDDPFLFVWDPMSHLDEVYLVSVKDKFSTPHRPGSYADLSLEVTGVAS